MKKMFYTLFALAAMAMTSTSCSDELENGASANGNEVAVSFKVQLENAVGSRAIGDGTNAKYLAFAVYKEAVNDTIDNEVEALRQDNIEVDSETLTATVTTRLVKGQTYNFIFWAQNEKTKTGTDAAPVYKGTYYDVKDLRNIEVLYGTNNSIAANDEKRDAFYAVEKELKITGPINETITLKRPFAQVNVGTKIGSLAEAATAETTITQSKMVIKGVASKLHPYSGKVSEAKDVTYTLANIPESNHTDLAGDLKDVKDVDYEYLSMNYILVNDQDPGTANKIDGTKKGLVNATFEVWEANATKAVNTFEIPNVPVQRNWRTNIIGDILSETVTFNIVIDPKFDTDENGEDRNYVLAEKLEYAAVNGGVVTLQDDVTLDGPIEITNDVNMVVNLNGKTISFSGKEDKTLHNAIFCVKKGTLTINGEGGIIDAGSGSAGNIAVWAGRGDATNDGKVIINGGHFKNGSASELIYAANKGIIEINGGTFEVGQEDKTSFASPQYAVLNLYSNGKLGADIIVKGGKFINFNPSDNVSEKPKKDFVANGYKVVPSGNAYYVIKETATAVATILDLNNALATANAEVTMVEDVTASAVVEMKAGTTLDGNGNMLTLASADNGTYAKGISTAGGSIKNLVIDGQNKKSTPNNKGYRAIFIENPTEDVIIDNVSISGVAYTMNTVGVDAADNLKLVVSNSTLVGWTSYVNFASAMFNNCHFGVGSYYDAATIAAHPGWNGCIRPYDTTTLSNCTFDSGFQLMLDKLPAGKTITLKNCMVGNEEVNQGNIQRLLNVAYDANKIKF